MNRESRMNRSGVGRRLRILGAAAAAALITASTIAPAMAEDHHDRGRREHERYEHERYEHERRERHEWRPYYYGAPGYVAPAPVYAPPAVVYAPPPAPIYAPPVAPSVNFVFPLRF